MTLSQAMLDAARQRAYALVAEDRAPHLVDQHAGDDPEDGGEDEEDLVLLVLLFSVFLF